MSDLKNGQLNSDELKTGNEYEVPKVSESQLEDIIENVKSDETLRSFDNATASEDAEFAAEIKKSKKSLKLNKLFTRKFGEAQFQRKILKHIFIPNDKTFVEKHFVKEQDKKSGKAIMVLSKQATLSRSEILKLNRIARDIQKQQHERINFIPLVAACVAVLLVLMFAYLFRNIISRKIVVSASEAAFGAKCDIKFIDFNLFDTHFQIKEYAVANQNAPMKNLFEIKNIDIKFNLLELSRGKFVCENIAVDGISWNTDRKTSGALPKKVKSQKDESSILNNNPVTQMINSELEQIKNGVSLSNGFEALREQTDPKLILQREMNAFQSPKIKDEIIDFVPTFVDSWKVQASQTESNVRSLVSKGQDISEIDFQNMSSPEEIQNFIVKITEMIAVSKKNIEGVQDLSSKIQDDVKKIETLGKNIETYVSADINHVKKVAAQIKDIKAKGASGFVSDLFRVFYLETLGSYYPRLMELIAMANQAQKSPKKENAQTLADKSKAMERLQGRNFLFSDHSAPTLLFKNVQLSGHSPDNDFTLAGDVQNITNDVDTWNKPITLSLSSTQKQFKETVQGTVDLRSATKSLVDVAGNFSGLDLDLDAKITGLPKLAGAFETSAEIEIGKNNDVRITTSGAVKNAKLTIEKFEPEILSRIYDEVLARINTVDVTTAFFKPNDSNLKLNILSTVDEQIFDSIQKQLLVELARVRELVIAEGQKYLEQVKSECLPYLENADEVISLVKLAVTDSTAFEKMLQTKLKEAEVRLTQLATNKLNDAANQIKDTVKDQIKDALKLPFGF
jgi:uncharacterized protein TP_0481